MRRRHQIDDKDHFTGGVEFISPSTGESINVTTHIGEIKISNDIDKEQFFKEMEERITRAAELRRKRALQ